MIGIEQKLIDIASRIDVPSLFEAQKDLVDMVNNDPNISKEEKEKLNAQFEDIKQKIKDLGND